MWRHTVGVYPKMMYQWKSGIHNVTTDHCRHDILPYFEQSCDDSAFPPTKTNRTYLPGATRAAAYKPVLLHTERDSPLSQFGFSHQAQPAPGVKLYVFRLNLPVVLLIGNGWSQWSTTQLPSFSIFCLRFFIHLKAIIICRVCFKYQQNT